MRSKTGRVIRFGGGLERYASFPPPCPPRTQLSRPALLHLQKCPRNMKRLLGEENPAQHFLAFIHGFSSSKLLANISQLIPATFL